VILAERDPLLSEVAVAIASYRSSPGALSIARGLFDDSGNHPFHSVIVVDSLGDGSIGRQAEAERWQRFVHRDATTNLGSAGNLSMRLNLAFEHGARWVYAVNHDGAVNAQSVRALAAAGEPEQRVGAVYPLRYRTRIERWDHTGATPWPTPALRFRARPRGGSEVYWASSNGALYSTAPYAEGLGVWADLWMGYEDMGYGWQLWRHGWKQILCGEAVFDDDYEYDTSTPIPITAKPPWYAYYGARNLFLIARRNGRGPATWAAVSGRLANEAAVTVLFRDQKRQRAALLARGIVDGLRGRSGHAGFP
jgi:GT2 family glycosyltransferase